MDTRSGDRKVKSTPNLVLFHNDLDGFGAALAAWLEFGDTKTAYQAVDYGVLAPWMEKDYWVVQGIKGEFKDTRVIILDFSYKSPEMARLRRLQAEEDGSFLILDHHKTTIEELFEEFGTSSRFLHIDPMSKCQIQVQMGLSGAVLSWLYFHGEGPEREEQIPELFSYIQEGDLYLWDLPYSREVYSALDSLWRGPKDFQTFRRFLEEWSRAFPGLCERGISILDYREKVIQNSVQQVRRVNFLGHGVPAVNHSERGTVSQLGSLLSQGEKFSVSWFQRSDGLYQYSLRSQPDGLDVSEIAREMGGGGHKHAAGFESDTLIF